MKVIWGCLMHSTAILSSKLPSYLAYHWQTRPGSTIRPCNFTNFPSSRKPTKKISVNLNHGLQETLVIAKPYLQTHLGRKTSQALPQAAKETHHKKIGVKARGAITRCRNVLEESTLDHYTQLWLLYLTVLWPTMCFYSLACHIGGCGTRD